MADIKNKNELRRRIELFLDDFSSDEYKINEKLCKETMKMMREFIGHTSHQLDCKNDKIKSLQGKLKQYKDLQRYRWIPVSSGVFPEENDEYILLSFENFSIPSVGRYEEDDEGGAFYIGDDDDPCVRYDVIVNAWMPLIKPYREDGGNKLDWSEEE